jgi:hypothetical protein
MEVHVLPLDVAERARGSAPKKTCPSDASTALRTTSTATPTGTHAERMGVIVQSRSARHDSDAQPLIF